MILERIKELLVEQLNLEYEQLQSDTLFDEIGVDSIDIVELVMALEAELGFKCPTTSLSGSPRLAIWRGCGRDDVRAPCKRRGGRRLAEQKADRKVLEERIHHHFAHSELLETALTHSSFANEQKPQQVPYNERLEFLGDSVLSIVVSQYIFTHFKALPEGDLSKVRATVVCEKSLRDLHAGWSWAFFCAWGEARSKTTAGSATRFWQTPLRRCWQPFTLTPALRR